MSRQPVHPQHPQNAALFRLLTTLAGHDLPTLRLRIPLEAGHPFRRQGGHSFRGEGGHPFRGEGGHLFRREGGHFSASVGMGGRLAAGMSDEKGSDSHGIFVPCWKGARCRHGERACGRSKRCCGYCWCAG
jgi:hypothetical protein